jgi:hypothetical protein
VAGCYTMAEEIDRRAGFYYNITTGQVERWGQSPEKDLLGPFATAAEAANAVEIIRAREERKEAEDREWREGKSR